MYTISQSFIHTFACLKSSHVVAPQIDVKIHPRYVRKIFFFDEVSECRITTSQKMN